MVLATGLEVILSVGSEEEAAVVVTLDVVASSVVDVDAVAAAAAVAAAPTASSADDPVMHSKEVQSWSCSDFETQVDSTDQIHECFLVVFVLIAADDSVAIAFPAPVLHLQQLPHLPHSESRLISIFRNLPLLISTLYRRQ